MNWLKKEAILIFGAAAVAVTSTVGQLTGGLTLKEFLLAVGGAVGTAVARQFVLSQATAAAKVQAAVAAAAAAANASQKPATGPPS